MRIPVTVMAMVGVFAAGGLLFGSVAGGTGLVLTGLPVMALIALALREKRVRSSPDLGWGGLPPAGADMASGGLEPAPAASVVRRPASSPGRLAAALARAESGQLVGDPWFGAGIGFCMLALVLLGWIWSPDDANRPWRLVFVALPVMAHPMAGMAVVAAHRAVTRARRDGASELFETCPLAPATRTAGHLLTGWVPAAALAVFCAGFVLVTAVRAGGVYGPIDSGALGDVAAAVALGVGGVALGVALGRWAPWQLAPMVAVAALMVPILALGNVGEPHWSRVRQLSTWPRYPDHDLLFAIRPVWWHLMWLVALAGVVSVLAVARHGGRRPILVLGAVAIAAAAVGIIQTRPLPSAGAARLASLVAEPERHQSCRDAGRVSVCAYRGYSAYAGAMIAEVAPVMAATPDTVPPVVHRQVFDGDLAALGPEVARALAGRRVGGRDDVPLGFEITRPTRTAARISTALAAVGLPVRPRAGGLPTVAAGQARGVVALWLAARGLERGEAMALASAYAPDTDHADYYSRPRTAQDLGMAWPEPCEAGPAPVAWAPEDLTAARAVLALPEARVLPVIQAHWADLVDPSTTTDDLLRALGLRTVGPVTPVVAMAVTCAY